MRIQRVLKCSPLLCVVFAAWLLAATVARAGNTFTILHDFGNTGTDGIFPYSSPVVAGNSLYGTTEQGGSDLGGSMYQYNLSTGIYSQNYGFTSAAQPSQPYAPPTYSGSVFYGTTFTGGSSNKGTIYQINPDGSGYSLLYSFTGSATDGDAPEFGALVITSSSPTDTVMYGLAAGGGGTANGGTHYKYDTASSTLTDIHSFGSTASDGIEPEAGLAQSGTLLIGTTAGGGANSGGTLFSYDMSSGDYQTLYNFGASSTDGNFVVTTPVVSGTIIYGATIDGGAHGKGTLYSFDMSDDAYNILYSFGSGPDDGTGPGPYKNGLLLVGSTLYGTTYGGGTDSYGSVFSYDLDDGVETVLHSFDVTDGLRPFGTLAMVGDTLYGTAQFGGTGLDANGVLYSISVPEPASFSILAAGSILLLSRRRSCFQLNRRETTWKR
jgi:uncharacterized repeat protein (TIGR03803 family)